MNHIIWYVLIAYTIILFVCVFLVVRMLIRRDRHISPFDKKEKEKD